jgi:hypothetical protein
MLEPLEKKLIEKPDWEFRTEAINKINDVIAAVNAALGAIDKIVSYVGGEALDEENASGAPDDKNKKDDDNSGAS